MYTNYNNIDIENIKTKKAIKRTVLKDRVLPDYTRGEEIFNMVSHIIGAVFGIVSLVLCIVFSAIHKDTYAIVSSVIYTTSLILLYTISSVYHGLKNCLGKKVMQVIDHCTIYFLIAGTYTPILLVSIREYSTGWAWTMFGIVWGLSVLGTVFTAIDLKKYSKLSMACYLGIGWSIVLATKVVLLAISHEALLLILIGGIFYSVGAVLYGIGKSKRYFHGIFHVFVLIGSICHFLAIFIYII